MSSRSAHVHIERPWSFMSSFQWEVDLDKVRELLLPLLGHTNAQLVARDLLGVVVAPVVNQVDPPQLEVVERLALEAVLNSSSTATLTRLVLVAGGLGGRFESR